MKAEFFLPPPSHPSMSILECSLATKHFNTLSHIVMLSASFPFNLAIYLPVSVLDLSSYEII